MVSNLEHYRAAAGFVGAWPATVREIDALASQFDEVVHLACLHEGDPPPQAESYRATNVRLELLRPAGGPGVRGKFEAFRALPGRMAAIERAWRHADAAVVRCPSNVSAAALGMLTAGLGPARVWVKYTGAWRGRRGESLAYGLQRRWLRTGLTGAAVTVGGIEEAPGGGASGLCNPSLTMAEARAAEYATRGKSLTAPWRLLSVGRLVGDKGVDVAIRALAALAALRREAELDIAGDGPARPELEGLAAALGVRDRVRFHGWLGAGALERLYSRSHALLAPSRAEGWSRAWTEAAARRCVPFASDIGAAGGLERSGAGLVIPTLHPAAWALRLKELFDDEALWCAAADRGPALARSFTYERFLEGARNVLRLDEAVREREAFEGA